jgi:hypothetical protein
VHIDEPVDEDRPHALVNVGLLRHVVWAEAVVTLRT